MKHRTHSGIFFICLALLDLVSYEAVINSTDCLVKIIVLDSNDDVEFRRTLINHADIDACTCQRREQLCSGSAGGTHAAADNCYSA